jgi:hypothetical protein
MIRSISLLATASVALTAALGLPARAQDVLPRPEQSFKGYIGRTVGESTTDFPQEVKAPKGAPNILLILTDDVGFGASSTFGGPVPTPTTDRLADEGLRYTEFHTTALCSPTRSALLTGRNHHSAATGVIMEAVTGFPGYNTLMPKSVGTFAEVLGQNGYNTAWHGKNHNIPDWHNSQAGPFDLWPTGLGGAATAGDQPDRRRAGGREPGAKPAHGTTSNTCNPSGGSGGGCACLVTFSVDLPRRAARVRGKRGVCRYCSEGIRRRHRTA